MRSRNIKFAKELCFQAVLDDAETLLKKGVIEYQVSKDDLLVRAAKDRFLAVRIVSEKNAVLSKLNASYGRALLRADMLRGEYISFTLLEFSDSAEYDKDNPFRIIVDQAAAGDLKMYAVEPEKALEEIRSQIILKEGAACCFAYARGDDSRNLEIIGERYSFVIAETPQKFLHITRMRRRTNKFRIDFPVVLIRGAIEIVDELTDRAVMTARANEQYSKLVSSDTEFIKLWNIYNELELESVRQQAAEMGFLKYRRFRYANGTIIFTLDGGYTRREFCADGIYYAVVQSIDLESPMNYDYRSATVIGTEIDHSCINTSEFRIKEDMDTTRMIPEQGYLLPSISGSVIQSRRRKQAQQNILSSKCPLAGLKNIIQGGVQAGIVERHRNPVSDRLEKEIFGSRQIHFTEKQKKALDTAINTPDIAIIQGPPGTGKTTVMKAVIKRIEELFGNSAKILITSTQHDAVDNAVEGMYYGGVPVNRVSVRRKKDNEDWLIYDWIDKMIESCENWLDQNDGNERGTVRKIFELLWRAEESGDLKKTEQILQEVFLLAKPFALSPELNSHFSKLLVELGVKNADSSSGEDRQLLELVRGQRLEKETYLDDGAVQLKKLERYLKFDCDADFKIPACWSKLMKITADTPQLEQYLAELKKNCEALKELGSGSDSGGDELLRKDIRELIKGIRLEIISREKDEDSLTCSLIWEFKQELTNSSNVEQLIKAYSRINAATCQQAANPYLSKSMNGFQEEYDFVIVDEAARSNPLDLLIPMAMGKKIILVGDHKQLPHMVEKAVVQEVAKREEWKNVEEVLEESLFMRLYESVSREDQKAGIVRTAMLSEQYRMHPDICGLVNVFYDGKLETMCKAEERAHNLDLYDNKALVWIDLPLCEEFPAETKRQSISRKCEVDRIEKELSQILMRNQDYKIGVITFYSAQAQLLQEMAETCFPGDIDRIRVGTVDAFQGKEFDVVLLSIVRSNRESEMRKRVGFLDHANRLCVAFSRAKRLLVAVGDSSTVARDDEREYVKALYEMLWKCQQGTGEYCYG